jgi:hypothetical protein
MFLGMMTSAVGTHAEGLKPKPHRLSGPLLPFRQQKFNGKYYFANILP